MTVSKNKLSPCFIKIFAMTRFLRPQNGRHSTHYFSYLTISPPRNSINTPALNLNQVFVAFSAQNSSFFARQSDAVSEYQFQSQSSAVRLQSLHGKKRLDFPTFFVHKPDANLAIKWFCIYPFFKGPKRRSLGTKFSFLCSSYLSKCEFLPTHWRTC